MTDYTNRQKQGFDAKQVLFTAGTVTANVAAGAGNSNEVEIGENVELEIIAQVTGAVTGTDTPTLTLAVQEATAEAGSYTAIPGGTFTDITATAAKQRIAIRTTKPWVSCAVTVSGTNPSFVGTTVFIVS